MFQWQVAWPYLTSNLLQTALLIAGVALGVVAFVLLGLLVGLVGGLVGALPGAGGLWIAWPKKSSGVSTDLDQNLVRRTGLASGLVDYKICAVDGTWSGLRFARRKKA